MEIRIKTDDAVPVLSDDGLDNDNYVQVSFEHAVADPTTGNTAYEDVVLDDLFAALIAFDSKRSRRIDRENLTSSPTQ